MARTGSRDLAVGALFALALIILAFAVMAVGGESRLFTPKISYRVVFPSADGLVVGSPVKISGVVVGTVSDIRLSTDPSQAGIEVVVGIDTAYAERVRADSRAALRILQILSGEKFVEITAGSESEPVLPEGSLLDVAEEQQLLEQAAATAENVNEITISLKNILGALERGDGLMGRMINDPEFGREGLESLSGAVENLRLLTDDLRHGKGFIGKMIYDEGFATQVDQLGRALGDLAAKLDRIRLDEGALGAMLQEGGLGDKMVDDLAASAASLRVITARLEAGESLLGQLVGDIEENETFADDLRATARNLAQITDKINRGEGTLGALVNDRVLHDSLEDVVAGLNDSKFARWLIRRYQKKGIELDLEPDEAEKP